MVILNSINSVAVFDANKLSGLPVWISLSACVAGSQRPLSAQLQLLVPFSCRQMHECDAPNLTCKNVCVCVCACQRFKLPSHSTMALPASFHVWFVVIKRKIKIEMLNYLNKKKRKEKAKKWFKYARMHACTHALTQRCILTCRQGVRRV